MNDRPDIHTLTGVYALDALPDEEREVFEQHLMVCAACAQEVAELQATASRLGAASHETPPSSLRARVLAEIDATRQEHPEGVTDDDEWPGRGRATLPEIHTDADRTGTGHPAWLTRVSVAAAAVLLVAVGGLSLVIAELNDRLAQIEDSSGRVADVLAAPDATVVATEGPTGGVARVVASPVRGEAVFLADDMAPAPEGHTYELWLIEPDAFVPAGFVETDDRGRATQVMTGDIAGASAIGVTVEPEGGSPQPTTEPVLVFELG